MKDLLQSRFSRRDILRYAALGAGALAVESACSTLPKTAPTLEQYKKQAELTKNPIFRAATVIVISSAGMGHGGIFRDGDLYFMTQNHVVPDRSDKPKLVVPGLGATEFTLDSSWEVYPGEADFDPNIRFRLSDGLREKLEGAIKAGVITPLSFYHDSLRSGDAFALPMPNNGKLSYLTYSKFHKDTNELEFDIENGYSCHGFSGTPVLKTNINKNLTTESVGLIKSVAFDSKLFAGHKCGNIHAFIKPHLKWQISSPDN